MVTLLRSRRTTLAALVFAVTAATVTPALTAPVPANASSRVVPVVSLASPQLPESIALDHRGNMYLSLAPLREIMKIAPDGTRSTYATLPAGAQSLGVRFDASGNAYVAVVGSGVWRVPAGGGAPAEIAAIPGFVNGLAFDRRGNLYVSDSLAGTIYRVSRDGSVTPWSSSTLLAGTTGPGPCGLPHPFGEALGANGIAIDTHGDLLVANTTLGTIVRIPVRPNGDAGVPSVYAGPDCRLWGADGVALDDRDNLYVAANAARDIVRVSPAGQIRVLASYAAGDPLYSPTDIAFGAGRGDRTRIFITNSAFFTDGAGAGVVTMNVGVPGMPLP